MTEVAKHPKFEISETTVEDVPGLTRMHVQSWLDTYVSPENGVTEEWLRARMEPRLTPEGLEERKQKFIERMKDPNNSSWVAKDESGEVIAFASTAIDDEGRQRVGALYVDKKFHGQGIARELMQRVLSWADQTKPLYLEVTSYNDRAIAFYRKWGFEVVDGSKKIIKFEKMPVIEMARRGDNQ